VEEAFHSLHLPGRIVDITRSIFVAERISFSFRGRKFFSSSSLAVAPPQRFIFNGERGAHNKNFPSPLPGRNMENLCSRRGETIFSINYIFSWHEQKEKRKQEKQKFLRPSERKTKRNIRWKTKFVLSIGLAIPTWLARER
jgi:hypothetical protein